MWKKGTDLRDDKGIYRWGAREYVSVTTVIDALVSKDMAFVNSYYVADEAARLVALAKSGLSALCPEYTIQEDGTPGWVQVEKDPRVLLADVEYLKHVPLRRKQENMDRGSTVHELLPEWCERGGIAPEDLPHWVEHRIIETDRRCSVEDVLPYAQSLLYWFEKHQPKIIACDVPVFHDGLGYAGTLDAIWELDGRRWIVDLKTSKATAVDHACQVAAYRHAEYVGIPGREKRLRMPQVDGAAILLVQPEYKATYREWPDTRTHFDTFKHCLAVHAAGRAGRHATTHQALCTGFRTKEQPQDANRIDVHDSTAA